MNKSDILLAMVMVVRFSLSLCDTEETIHNITQAMCFPVDRDNRVCNI